MNVDYQFITLPETRIIFKVTQQTIIIMMCVLSVHLCGRRSFVFSEFLQMSVGWLTEVGVASHFPPIKAFITFIYILITGTLRLTDFENCVFIKQ